jgi:plastocyanin
MSSWLRRAPRQGTGRAADLIAEAVEMYEESMCHEGHEEEGEELVVLQREQVALRNAAPAVGSVAVGDRVGWVWGEPCPGPSCQA